jgi:hypothetical protein
VGGEMLNEVKSYLGITWLDEDSDIQNMIDRGKSRLEGLAGVTLDFTVEGLARELLFEYCRYAYNNAIEFFEENFQREILRLQLQIGVNEYITTLAEINIENVTLEPEFEPIITDYTAETDNETSNIEAVPRAPEADISIKINGETFENDTEYSWEAGENTVDITVENNGNSQVYTVVVTYEN